MTVGNTPSSNISEAKQMLASLTDNPKLLYVICPFNIGDFLVNGGLCYALQVKKRKTSCALIVCDKFKDSQIDFIGVSQIIYIPSEKMEIIKDYIRENSLYETDNYIYGHFHVKNGGYDWNTKLIGEMFAEDANVCMALEKKKFYSNNLPMFYNASDLQKILDFLYKENPSRASQVPSFKTVFVRKNFPDFLASHGFSFAGGDAETRLKWQNALYYLLKEIYYNAFLTSPDVKDDFFKALDGLPAENEDALNDFIDTLNAVYFENMERVNGDIGWFIDKFDYRFKNEPWKNSKDALPRGIIKTNHTIISQE